MLKEGDTYPISITKSSYQGKQLTEEQSRMGEVTARKCLPSYLFFGHCADESNPYDNMQQREFYSSYATLFQDPTKMTNHTEAAVTFLDSPAKLPVISRQARKSDPEHVDRFLTTNQVTMGAPLSSTKFRPNVIDRSFRQSLDQTGRRLHLPDSH